MRTGRIFAAALLALAICVLFTACPRDKKNEARQEEPPQTPQAVTPAQDATPSPDEESGDAAAHNAALSKPAAAHDNGEDANLDKAFAEDAAARSANAGETIVDKTAQENLAGAADAAAEAQAAMEEFF